MPERGVGRRFPAELREEAVGLLREARASGISGAQVAKQLGIRVTSLRRWAKAGGPAPAKPCFHEVAVVEHREDPRPVVVLPSGIRVEGLDLGGVVALLSQLA